MGVLDFELYHTTSVLARVLDWFPCLFSKASTMIEQDLSPVNLRALLWGYKRDFHRLQSSSLLTLAALHLWYKKGLQNLLSLEPSPLTMLFDNPTFLEGMGTPILGGCDDLFGR